MKKAITIIVLVLAPIALGYGIWTMFFAGDGTNLPNRLQFVDVTTGELIMYSRNEVTTVPMKNSRDGKRTIFPVERDAAGNWVITERTRPGLERLADENLKVDPQTFVVQTN